MADLEKIGLAGPDALRDLLTTSDDPIQAIRDFQESNGIQLRTLVPALSLLDLQEVYRAEFHQLVQDELQKLLVEQIMKNKGTDAGQIKLKALLDKCFDLRGLSPVKTILLSVLGSLDDIPESYLTKIKLDTALYKEAPVSVKRQIWILYEDLFLQELNAELDAFFAQKLDNLTGDRSDVYFRISSRKRRNQAAVLQIVKLVTGSVVLYERVLAEIRRRFFDSFDVHWCSLRFELLMALHEAPDCQAVVREDACHKFAWCLDACVRERHIDGKHAKELQYELDSHKKLAQILPDFAMLLAEPYCLHFLVQLALKLIHQSIQQEQLARDNPNFVLMLRLVSLGACVNSMFNEMQTGRVTEPKPISQFGTDFLSLLILYIMDDHARALVEKIVTAGEDPSEVLENCEADSFVCAPGRNLVQFICCDRMAALIWIHYVLDIVQKKDVVALRRALPSLLLCKDNLALSPVWLNSLLSSIALNLIDAFQPISEDELRFSMFENFLLSDRRRGWGLEQKFITLRFLATLVRANRIALQNSKSILESPVLNAGEKDSDLYKEVHKMLLSKIESLLRQSTDAAIEINRSPKFHSPTDFRTFDTFEFDIVDNLA